LLCSLFAQAQKMDSVSRIKTGFICQFTYNYNFPTADLAKRYTGGSAVGAGVYYKTGTNWIFGVEGSYWFSANLKEAGIFDAVVDSNGYAVDNQGSLIPIDAEQRGFNIGGKIGKIIPLGTKNRNSGIMISLGVGYVEHYLRLTNASLGVAALQGDFRYGYDRLATGYYLNQFIGYQNLDKKNRINFFIGLEFSQGHTQSRRKIDYDLMKGNPAQRRDNYIGIRFGWLLPIYTGEAQVNGGYRFK
ncbi:MAG: hypothetical protein LPK45_01715, partial [Bacteroidota bacterium]|nr:hypothetical protein [Bacteroidota bacterium]MDX5429752.1 hypothetical protein [Bacteroidota bacterium]MDX5468531.1 hypothetical protein [Bacteroidota bacterium]